MTVMYQVPKRGSIVKGNHFLSGTGEKLAGGKPGRSAEFSIHKNERPEFIRLRKNYTHTVCTIADQSLGGLGRPLRSINQVVELLEISQHFHTCFFGVWMINIDDGDRYILQVVMIAEQLQQLVKGR